MTDFIFSCVIKSFCKTFQQIINFHSIMFNLQIVAGVEHIHSQKYVHRDLKLENVFLNEQLRAKIGDFGMSAKIRNDLPRKSFCGTPNYMARKLERKKISLV